MVSRFGKTRAFLAIAMLGTAVAGCGDGLEVHSKFLDTIAPALASSKGEPTLADRPGLVIPPPMAQLPEPGTGSMVASQLQAQLPNAPEAQAAIAAAEKKKQQAAACEKLKEKQWQDDQELKAACPGLLTRLWQSGSINPSQ